MRISADDKDSGYHVWDSVIQAGQQVVVRVNGVECGDVITADTDEGFILRCKRNADGEIYADGDDIAVEVVHGVVTVDVVLA